MNANVAFGLISAWGVLRDLGVLVRGAGGVTGGVGRHGSGDGTGAASETGGEAEGATVGAGGGAV